MKNVEAENHNLEILSQDGVKPLPDWEKIDRPFDRIAELKMYDDDKDALVLWWKENPQLLAKLAQLKQVSTSINLPKNEAEEVSRVYKESLTSFNAANNGLLAFIGEDRKILGKVLDIYASVVGVSKKEVAARSVRQFISEFNHKGVDLTIAVAQAIIDTRSQNPDENLLRKKAAQQVFQEMFDQMVIARIVAVNNIDAAVSRIIDYPQEEKSDLTSAFLSKPWTDNERGMMIGIFNNLRGFLNRLETVRDEKIGLNNLWEWANGNLPKDINVFEILYSADNLYHDIMHTVADVWQAELDRKNDDEEDDEENEN